MSKDEQRPADLELAGDREEIEQKAAPDNEEAIPVSDIAVMGIMRGWYKDGSDAADHLLEEN